MSNWGCYTLLRLIATIGFGAMSLVKGEYVPAVFIFGDSIVDAGNNNKLVSIARANHLPYGMDFMGGHPTGRFCNGRLTVDFLASVLGLPFPPPYLSAGNEILNGVNFASSGSGILNSTGYVFGERISLWQQVKYFDEVKNDLVVRLGYEEASSLLSKALVLVVTGSNDYMDNYVLPPPIKKTPLQIQYSPISFMRLLISFMRDRLLEMYRIGARKIGVTSLPPIGCLPFQVALSSNGGCQTFLNNQATMYNAALLSLLKQLQLQFPDATFVYLNIYDFLLQTINNPNSEGFLYGSKSPCCGFTAKYVDLIPCQQGLMPLCRNTSEHMFWDFAHPTDAFNLAISKRLWEGSEPDVYPINLKQLASI